jgi:hypothetical protein
MVSQSIESSASLGNGNGLSMGYLRGFLGGKWGILVKCAHFSEKSPAVKVFSGKMDDGERVKSILRNSVWNLS